MDHGHEIRRQALEIRKQVCEKNGLATDSLHPSDKFAILTLEHLDLSPVSEHPDSANLHGSLAVLEDDIVFYSSDLEGGFRDYCIAHEAGHRVLHFFTAVCEREDIQGVKNDQESGSPKVRVIGYGAKEKKERDANLFALELLLPCGALRRAFVEERLTAVEIAKRTGMPVSYVKRQLARAVLIPGTETGDERQETGDGKQETGNGRQETGDGRRGSGSGAASPRILEERFGTPSSSIGHRSERIDLDPSQQKAVGTDECPVLISAGPGTGKTETLIRRVVHLLDQGANPNRILALTFSNKAAEEMRERISEARPDAAARIHIMTFHSFGFNLLMRYSKEAGIEQDSRLLDQIDALLMLEGHLADLRLEHYLALYDPMRDLPDILTAISKAKDELCDPARYREHAEAMLAAAEDDDEIRNAEKALEVARVYEHYQRLMDEQGFLDFGDLIFRPVKLLETREDVRKEVAGSFDHVLVDEFQDVNRASGVLLRLVAGEGRGLWAVGDLRQSIYRWRGASPANIREFHDEFAGARMLSLEINYRSVEPIVKAFGEFGKGMIAREPFNEWESSRGRGEIGAVTYDVADRFDTEAAEIAKRMLSDHGNGVAFRDQAVICGTHGQLSAIGDELTRKGIPVFYLGQLFERPEVRDLLSFLDLASSNNAHPLLRVGAFPEYGMPLGDVFSVITAAEDRQTGLRGIDPGDKELNLSDDARAGLRKLKEQIEHDHRTSAYGLLSDYLFTSSEYLRRPLAGDSVADKQKLIAIYQLAGFASSMEGRFADSPNPIADFLQYIKRLVLFREQKNLAEIPAAASGLDAVRLLTVHGAKGLEFGSVYLPYLAAGKMPRKNTPEKCPTPPGLRGDPKEDHAEEEQCLFFVALSRARDRLHLSRSVNYSERSQSKESPFLSQIETALPEPRVLEPSEKPPAPKVLPPDAYNRREFYTAELDRYLDCAKQYYYRYEAGLKTGDNRSAYQKLHGIVFETLREVQDARIEQPEVAVFARETMERLWEEADLAGHPYARLYREKAEYLLERVIERFGRPAGTVSRKTIRVPLTNGGVKVSADSIEEIGPEGAKRVIARNVKTGKQPKSVVTKDADAALLKALKIEYPDAEVSVAKVFLTDDSEFTQEISETVIGNRLKKYEGAIDGINRGEFDPNPNARRCPTCAYYFMCENKTGDRGRETEK